MVTLEAAKITLKQKLFLMFSAALITSAVVFVFLFIWDGRDWGFIDGHFMINVLILLGLGLLFSLLYFKREFSKNLTKKIEIGETKTTITDRKSTRIYHNNQAIHVRFDKQFYGFIKHERLTITFAQMGLSSKRHESLILPNNHVSSETLIQALKGSAQSEHPTEKVE